MDVHISVLNFIGVPCAWMWHGPIESNTGKRKVENTNEDSPLHESDSVDPT